MTARPGTVDELRAILQKTGAELTRLRDYQLEAVEALKRYRAEALAKGQAGRALVPLFMGGGKTVIFAHLVPLAAKRVLILAHRDELLRNTMEEVQAAAPGVTVGLDKAGERPGPSDKVVVASVQTIWHPDRLAAYDPREFSLLVIDEAHHAAARSYLLIGGHFGVVPSVSDIEARLLEDLAEPRKAVRAAAQEAARRFETYRPPRTAPFTVGFTATPGRTDRRGLSVFFDRTIEWPDGEDHDLLWGVEHGWLVEPAGLAVETGADISGVKSHMTEYGRDFSAGGLSRVLNTPARNALILDTHLAHYPNAQGVVFLSDVKHVEDFAALANARGVATVGVTARTPAADRPGIIRDFKAGRIKLLANYAVFTEGTNLAGIAAVHMARPTQSSLVYTQAIGRGGRPIIDLSAHATAAERRAAIAASGKPRFTVFDYVDASRVGVQSMHALLGIPPKVDLGGGALAAARAAREASGVPMAFLGHAATPEEIRAAYRAFDPLRRALVEEEIRRLSPIAWTRVENGYFLRMLEQGEVYVLIGPEGVEVWARLANRPAFPVSGPHRNILDAIASGDRYVQRSRPDAWFYSLGAPWRALPMTQYQQLYLDRMKVPYPPAGMTRGDAQLLIDASIYRRQPWVKPAGRCERCSSLAVVRGLCLRCGAAEDAASAVDAGREWSGGIQGVGVHTPPSA